VAARVSLAIATGVLRKLSVQYAFEFFAPKRAGACRKVGGGRVATAQQRRVAEVLRKNGK
jgi:hypothetical protein